MSNSEQSDRTYRSERIRKLVAGYLQRMLAGEDDNREALLAENADLMPGLGEELDKAALIGHAYTLAWAMPADDAADMEDQVERGSGGSRLSVNIEGYKTLRELSRGGQGAVFQALERGTKRKVAIKVLHAARFVSDRSRKRFEREIELIAQLKHPNIISVHHSGITKEGLPYYVMDYVRGRRLDRHVREEDLSLEETLELFQVVCDAVQHAHQRGVIHRDLKPSNIIVDANGTPIVLDFGLAKSLSAPIETVVSLSEELIGTLPYMAPEQTLGNPDRIDTRTDIYSLGVILYEVLTGTYPYPVVGTMVDVLKHIAETPPDPPAKAWKKDSGVTHRSGGRAPAPKCPIDRELQDIILYALAKRPEKRFASAAEFSRNLHRYLVGEPIEPRHGHDWYMFQKLLWRRRLTIATVLGCVVLLTAAGLGVRSIVRTRETNRLVEQARTLVVKKQYGDAYSKFKEALRYDAHNYRILANGAIAIKDAYFEKPYTYKDVPSLEEALDWAERALRLQPENAGIMNVRAVVLYSLGQLDRAERDARAALNLDYYHAAAPLGKVLALQGRFDEAITALEQGIKLQEEHEQEKNKYDDGIWLNLGTIQLHLQRERAVETLKMAREIDPRDTRNRLMLARAYLTLVGHIDVTTALEEARHAFEFRERGDPMFSRILGLASLRNGLLADAVKYAEYASEGGDKPAYNQLIIAIARSRLGQVELARDALDNAIENWPKEFEADRVIVEAEKGLLWFDTADELEVLRKEAEALIVSASPSPDQPAGQ